MNLKVVQNKPKWDMLHMDVPQKWLQLAMLNVSVLLIFRHDYNNELCSAMEHVVSVPQEVI